MNVSEAKRIIAAYLVGENVSAQMLAEAWAVVGGADGHDARFVRGLGYPSSEVNLCARVRANLDDYCELSAVGRSHEAPELENHLRTCEKCRRALRVVRSLDVWRPVTEGGRSPCARVLSECIRVAIDLSRRLTDIGWGPPPMLHVATAGALEKPSTLPPLAPGPERPGAPSASVLQWALPDDETGFILHLCLRAVQSDGVEVACYVEAPTRVANAVERRWQIAISEAGSGRLCAAGALTDFADEPLVVPAGHWLVRLSDSSTADAGQEWEIPLELAGAQDE
jgi:hypothetical protein